MSEDATGGRAVVRYAPKRDWCVLLLMWGVALVAAWAAFGMRKEALTPLARVGAYLGAAFVVTLSLGDLYKLSYVLSDDALRVGFGPVGIRVPLDTIESVTPGFGPWIIRNRSMSLRSLHIARRGKLLRVAIAPLRREAFLRDLAARGPHLELRAGELTRRD